MIALVPLLLAASAPAQPRAMFSVNVDLVQVTVSVTTKDGQPVRDLEAKDFVVSDDGKKRPIESFLRTADVADSDKAPVDLVLLLDTSESMGTDLAQARDVMIDFVKSIPSPRGRGIVAFGEDVQAWRFDADNMGTVLGDIFLARASRGTRFFDGVIEGLRRVSVGPGRKAMVAFTDGEDSTSVKTVDDARRSLAEAEVTFYAVSYAAHLKEFEVPRRDLSGPPPDKEVMPRTPARTPSEMPMMGGFVGQTRRQRATVALETLAKATGGLVLDGSAGDLATRFGLIRNDIASQYVLGFAASPSQKAVYRKLKVEVRRKDTKVRHREGYVTKPRP